MTLPSDNSNIVPGKSGDKLVSFVQLAATPRTGKAVKSTDKTNRQNPNPLFHRLFFDMPCPFKISIFTNGSFARLRSRVFFSLVPRSTRRIVAGCLHCVPGYNPEV